MNLTFEQRQQIKQARDRQAREQQTWWDEYEAAFDDNDTDESAQEAA